MVDEQSIIYLVSTSLVGIILIATAGAYGPFALIMAVLMGLAILLNIVINYADFIVFPFFTKTLNITMIPAAKYTIPPTQDSIVKYVNGIYYATGYLTGNLYNYVFTTQQQAQGDQGDMGAAMDKWERIIMNVDFPFKFNVITIAENVQKYREELEGQRGYLEFQLNREMNGTNPNSMAIEDFQRRIAILQGKMDRVATGERPLNTIIYTESTAVGVSEKEAMDALTTQLNQLQTVFNAFDLSIIRVTGREIYYLSQFNYKIPNEQELRKLFQVQK